ncbi:hypothetical protein evm_005019 [Chilo suppressalis]|nr:hypothetical protein evm_005019 [Chilo suppressalis]
MESTKDDSKRKRDKTVEDSQYRDRDRRYKRARTKSRSPVRISGDSRRKRKQSRSPERVVKQERGTEPPKGMEPKKDVPERKPKETDMLNTRTGGAYIPPARLRMMQAQITDKSSVAYQRLAWEALKKSIHGHINKINVGNIGIIIKELLKENIVRGRGLLCRSVIQAQAASPTFTNVYAALVAAVNSRFPNIGELLLKRLVIQFKRGFKRNDKPTCISSASFIAHLVNQRVAHEILALELLTLLVETPTDDSVEVAIAFLKECGQKLTEVSSKGVNAIFEMLRNILHEGQVDKRVQYMIEVMFQVWKDGFKDHPALIEELELVPEEEQFTHLLMLDDATDPQDILNVFKFDDKYEENEQKYKSLSKEILGSDAESGEEDGSEESGSDESGDEEDGDEQKPVTIIDNTETNLVALRRTIYLTINSSLDFEECAHKLMKMQLKPGQEVELCHMFLDCCAEQRTYEKFYGLLAQRFCNINRIYIGPFEEIFKDSYATAHRLDTNRLRNVSKFFAHLLFTDSISWEVLECVKLNEEDTTSSSRIYIKILFQELAEYMGLKKLNDRLKDPTLQYAFSGIFPRDNPKNTRFSINFFTSIGLGGLTDELREHLKQMPKNVPAPVQEINVDSESDSSSSSSSSSSDDSSSSSQSSNENRKKKKTNKKQTKEKTPQTPEPEETNKTQTNERWGHDGFYDTYGKDARRTENKERDRDNFVRPQDRGNGRDKNTTREIDYNSRDSGDRRRREERNGHNSDDERRTRNTQERYERRRDHDQDHRRNDEHRKREDYDSARQSEKNYSDRRYTEQREDESRRRDGDRKNDSDRRNLEQRKEDKYKKTSERENNRTSQRDNREDEERVRDKSNKVDKRTDSRESNTEEENYRRKTNKEEGRKHDNSKEIAYDRSKNRNERHRRDISNLSSTEARNEKYAQDALSNHEDSRRKKSDKDRSKQRKDKHAVSDHSSSEDSEDECINNRKKTDTASSKKRHEKKDKRSVRNDKDSSSSSSEESDDTDHRKNKKEKRKHRKDKRNKENSVDDGWDIKSSSDVRKELGQRYWQK